MVKTVRCSYKRTVAGGLLVVATWSYCGLQAAVHDQPRSEQNRTASVRPQSAPPSLNAAPLRRVIDVRSLPQERAASKVPVRLTGVVTDLSGFRNSFFLNDATGSIAVDRTDTADVHVNDRVELIGTSGPGLFAPVILASAVHVLGTGEPPEPRKSTYIDMAGGALDSQWIQVQGVIHSARMDKVFDRDVLVLRVQGEGGSLRVLLQDFTGLDYGKLVDAKVRIRGVCGSDFNEKRQLTGITMFVPRREDVAVVEAAPADPFAAPVTRVRNALQFGQTIHRIKIEGIVTYQHPGHALHLQDGSDGIEVETLSRQNVPVGARVEAVGFPVLGEYSPKLADGDFRVIGSPQANRVILPVKITAGEVIRRGDFAEAQYDQQLVSIDGQVIESDVRGEHRMLMMQQGAEIFTASLLVAHGDSRAWEVGNRIRLTGICEVHTDVDRNPVGFTLELRSPGDIVLLRHRRWWTPEHTLILLSILGGVTLSVVLWVVILRHRVQRQTRMIRESESRFRDLAQRDALTGLPNRFLLEERIETYLAKCSSTHRYVAIYAIDVDRFKHINDTYGHVVADQVLKALADRLRTHVRQTDLLARTGGEEFTLVIGELAGRESARRIANSLLDLFQEPVCLPGQEIKITVSIGGAIYPDDGAGTEILRRRSDQALYEAKRTGRNRAVFASEELARSSELAIRLETALRESLQQEKFVLFYQPICDAHGQICRFEALVRATDERLKAAGPAQFIPVAEECGLIVPLGRWVLGEACRQIAAWKAAGLRPCPVNVNISGRQLMHRGFADELAALLERYQLLPELLELELTETAVMTEVGALADIISRLAEAGHSFAIDDFGTGYSSLSRLRELPIKTLKIDRSFVINLEKDSNSYTIILAITQMAKSLSLEVVAEGVETAQQFEMLRELRCDFFQGYLFARPLAADAAIATVKEKLPAHARTRLLTAASY